MNILSYGQLLLFVKFRPCIGKSDNILEIVNETTVLAITMSIYGITDYVDDLQLRNDIGWCIVGLTLGMMAVNILTFLI